MGMWSWQLYQFPSSEKAHTGIWYSVVTIFNPLIISPLNLGFKCDIYWDNGAGVGAWSFTHVLCHPSRLLASPELVLGPLPYPRELVPGTHTQSISDRAWGQLFHLRLAMQQHNHSQLSGSRDRVLPQSHIIIGSACRGSFNATWILTPNQKKSYLCGNTDSI